MALITVDIWVFLWNVLLTLTFFQIAKHKTDNVGPATVGFPQPLWSWIKSYLHMLQMMDGYIESEMEFHSIFVSFRNNRGARPEVISSSGVNRALNSLWKTVHLKGRVSATKLRKAIVTCAKRGAIGQRRTGQTHGPPTDNSWSLLSFATTARLGPSNIKADYTYNDEAKCSGASNPWRTPPTRFPRHPDKDCQNVWLIWPRPSTRTPTQGSWNLQFW